MLPSTAGAANGDRRPIPVSARVDRIGLEPDPIRCEGDGVKAPLESRSQVWRCRLSMVALVAGGGVLLLAGVAWGIRVFASDTVASLQKISWIPVPMLIVAMSVAVATTLAASSIAHRGWGRRLGLAGAALLVVVAGEHLATRWGWGWGDDCVDPLRVLHWNATSPKPEEAQAQRDHLAELDWDVLLVSNDASLFGRWFAHRWEDGPGGRAWPVRRAGPFALVTDHRVLESRLAIASGGIWLGVFRVELPIAGGREIVIHAIDLPSDPDLPRASLLDDLAQRLRNLRLPAADLVMGDLNLDAGSRVLAGTYPSLDPAFDRAGRGYAASYPRRWPLWQTDQTLVARDLPVCGYELLDLGFGTHRAQALSIERSPGPQRSSVGSSRSQIQP